MDHTSLVLLEVALFLSLLFLGSLSCLFSFIYAASPCGYLQYSSLDEAHIFAISVFYTFFKISLSFVLDTIDKYYMNITLKVKISYIS